MQQHQHASRQSVGATTAARPRGRAAAVRGSVTAPAAERAGCRILVVDDDPAIRQLLCDLLESEGYAAADAPDAASGLARLREERFDLVVLDRLLPDADGLEFCERARTLPREGYLPILML